MPRVRDRYCLHVFYPNSAGCVSSPTRTTGCTPSRAAGTPARHACWSRQNDRPASTRIVWARPCERSSSTGNPHRLPTRHPTTDRVQKHDKRSRDENVIITLCRIVVFPSTLLSGWLSFRSRLGGAEGFRVFGCVLRQYTAYEMSPRQKKKTNLGNLMGKNI